MSKKQNELKDALQMLKVSEALRLSKGSATKDFAFKPPKPSEIKLNSVRDNPSLNEAQVDSISEHNKLGVEPSQISTKRSQINSISDSVSSTGFDLSPFLAGINKIQLVERGEGSFHIPHKIYEFVHKAVDTKVELLVFNCLLRYTLGFQRATCQASQSFISRWTGIAVPNVRKALKSLIERRFIRRIEEGTIAHDSAVYELPIVTAFLAYEYSRKAGLKKSLDQQNLESNSPQIRDQIDPGSQIDSIPKKERENKTINKTLSLTEFSNATLKSYFDGKLPEKRRERDLQRYFELHKTFSEDQIGKALGSVLQEGMPGTNEKPYSVWEYLAYALPEVLRLVEQKEAILAMKGESNRKHAESERMKREQEIREQQEFTKKEQAFLRTFSTLERQEEAIHEICRRQKILLRPESNAARSVAIQTWWEELSGYDRQSFSSEGA